MRRSLWFSAAILLLGCWTPQDSALFEPERGLMTGIGSSGGVAADVAGATNIGAQAGTASGSDVGGGSGTDTAGGSFVTAGSSSGASGGTLVGGAGTGSAPPIPVIESCDMVEGAVVSELNGHCYRASMAELDFPTAREACRVAGGHLVTIGSEAENEFARDLHDGEHWIGASDNLPDTTAGVGTYTWVNDEPWDYSAWEDEQPNAFEVDCADGVDADDVDCYEHCAFQTDEGDWNDRSCWHTIVGICEWDVEAVTGAGGMGGAPL